MNTKLIFFGSTSDSTQGTLRGAIALIGFLILSYLWYMLIAHSLYTNYRDDDVSTTRKLIGACFAIFVLISAIGVQLPSSLKEAAVYGALVGFALYGFMNGTNLVTNKRMDYKITALDTAWGVISTSLLSVIVYLVFNSR